MTGRFALVGVTLAALAVRLWALDGLGFSYDEAATALMARATAAEIVRFHWTAAFEHPPLWQLLVHNWSALTGQSEIALRLLSALAGTLAVPLIYQLSRTLFPRENHVALVSAVLAAFLPILNYYSQEARMYAVVLVLALASMLAFLHLLRAPRGAYAALVVTLNWGMTGFHYYAVLLIGAQLAFLSLLLLTCADLRPRWWLTAGALLFSLLPVGLWMALAPGFRSTLTVVMATAGADAAPWTATVAELWQDLTVASIRWAPAWVWIGYTWLLLLAVGLWDALWLRRGDDTARLGGWFLLCFVLLPVAASWLVFGDLVARYLLFIVPGLVILLALALTRLWRLQPLLGMTGGLLVLLVAGAGLFHYHTAYTKSDYRAMTEYLRPRLAADEALLLEGPRQHLLAKYYMPADLPLYPIPVIELPAFWPVNAPPVVPEEVDGAVQSYLARHPSFWLSLTAQDEVDPGEFLTRYLTAVAYTVDCSAWHDVRLCHYVSPDQITPELATAPALRFNDELLLPHADFAIMPAKGEDPAHLLVRLEWVADSRPSLDYKVALRLEDGGGPTDGAVVAQEDAFPIGPLLPPSTWGEGDVKPGLMSIPLGVPPGTYRLTLTLYDPATLTEFPASDGSNTQPVPPFPLVLANVRIGDTIDLLPPDTDE